MKFRILLRSFDNELMNLASQQLRTVLLQTDSKVKGVVALPTKLKLLSLELHFWEMNEFMIIALDM